MEREGETREREKEREEVWQGRRRRRRRKKHERKRKKIVVARETSLHRSWRKQNKNDRGQTRFALVDPFRVDPLGQASLEDVTSRSSVVKGDEASSSLRNERDANSKNEGFFIFFLFPARRFAVFFADVKSMMTNDKKTNDAEHPPSSLHVVPGLSDLVTSLSGLLILEFVRFN